MAAAGQIRLAVVTGDKSGAVPAVLADGSRTHGTSGRPSWAPAATQLMLLIQVMHDDRSGVLASRAARYLEHLIGVSTRAWVPGSYQP
jgi:hypothetical protein